MIYLQAIMLIILIMFIITEKQTPMKSFEIISIDECLELLGVTEKDVSVKVKQAYKNYLNKMKYDKKDIEDMTKDIEYEVLRCQKAYHYQGWAHVYLVVKCNDQYFEYCIRGNPSSAYLFKSNFNMSIVEKRNLPEISVRNAAGEVIGKSFAKVTDIQKYHVNSDIENNPYADIVLLDGHKYLQYVDFWIDFVSDVS